MSDSSREIVLDIRHVSRTYKLNGGLFKPAHSIHALRDVSIQLERGSTLGLVGESGCGKSTLASIMLGLNTPDSGDVLLNGKPILAMSRLERSSLIQPVFQDPYSSLNPAFSVHDNLLQPLLIHKSQSNSAERSRLVMAMLDKVGFPRHLAHARPGELSGGQCQRVAIARALMLNPPLLICDEPTSALDVSVQAQVINLLLDLKQEFNLTMVFISHNLAVVEHLADHVCVMYQGQVVEKAEGQDLFASPQHPYTKELLSATLLPAAS
ncbi:ATP-binding cassette domain-containing protein [Marinobacterium rhizophilum]|uniref:ABC transporter ATP-binding protein n=1 Tax=Marinobacterium rhizophilum TaxID=420402 RepID=A0ABY5HIU5_9GAMM|nr:ATP-binding cassette domain-containing protein [Marinobacterium rhizophilum]UTW12024.1 ABC transporter ATP-binding protein [Marinobacterium rhizophilum]